MSENEALELEKQMRDNGWIAAPPPEPAPTRWRVSKDTIISRVTALGSLPQVMAALDQQSAEQQFIWTHSAWFWSDNPNLRALCTSLGLDPDVVLAADEYI